VYNKLYLRELVEIVFGGRTFLKCFPQLPLIFAILHAHRISEVYCLECVIRRACIVQETKLRQRRRAERVSVCLPACLPAGLCVCLSTYLSTYLSIYLICKHISVCSSVLLFIHASHFYLSFIYYLNQLWVCVHIAN
jgi:hypothetical protein